MPKHANFQEAVLDNQTKLCAVNGCTNHRHRISKWCGKHAYQRWHWGHPLSRHFGPSEYAAEKAEVVEVINLNVGHEGIQYALDFLTRYLESSANGTSLAPHPDTIARLVEDGITAADVLAEVASLYLLVERGSKLIKSKLHLTYFVGHKVAALSKKPAGMTGKKRREIGEYLVDNLAVLFINVAKAAQTRAIEQDRLINDLGKPLNLR